jgi:thiamine biosynthesis lipoprotein
MNELVFSSMGTTVRLLADAPLEPIRAGIEAIAARLTRVEPASLDALRSAPPRRTATPGRRWREVEVREATIRRPPGLRIDLGGSAKGLAADWAASQLRGRFAVDCGGDVRVGGTHDVALRGTAHTLRVTDAAIATSGIDRRVWQRPDGSYAHHLLDPGTGEPAWTGVISATAIAPTALEAEALAKAALLSGPRRGRAYAEIVVAG